MDEETLGLLAGYELPDLPEPYDGDGARQLFLFRQGDGRATLGMPVSLEDAQEYCSREDTHGDGWFVGFDHA